MTKIAYLILAHNHPELLARIARRLEHRQAEIFIHIDSKSEIAPFVQALNDVRGVHFLNDRKNVAWGGFSLIDAVLALIRAAHAQGPFKYYVHISGIDYPLKNAQAMVEFFTNHELSFIDYFRARATLNKRFQFLRRHQHYYPTDVDFFNIRNVRFPVGKLLHQTKLVSLTFFLYGHLIHKRKLPFDYYNGSNWWNLTEEVIAYLLYFIGHNPWYVEHYHNKYCPGEMFIQTALLNSPIRDRVDPSCNNDSPTFPRDPVKDHSRGVSMGRGSLRYVDWTRRRGHPAILELRDFEAIKASGMLFARKLHPERSASLMERIDREMLLY